MTRSSELLRRLAPALSTAPIASTALAYLCKKNEKKNVHVVYGAQRLLFLGIPAYMCSYVIYRCC